VRTLAFTFYKPEEYALINSICHASEQKFKTVIWTILGRDKEHQTKVERDIEQHLAIKKQELIERFYEAEKNLMALKESKMIMDKERDAEYVKINGSFFDMVSSICDSMFEIIEKEQKSFADEKEKICKGCQRKRPTYEIQARVPCECGSMETLVQDNKEKQEVLELLKRQMGKVSGWRQEMDNLYKREKEREFQEKNKNLGGHRATDVDKDIAQANEYIEKHRAADFVSPWAAYPLKRNGLNLRKAEAEFAPKRYYHKIEELGQLRKKRKLDREEKRMH
jgi:hypothetical protein